jgi:hypothetical protein
MKNFLRSAANWKLVVPVLFLGFCFAATTAQAQLSLEGPTGIYVTPLAYTAASSHHNFGRPYVGFHYMPLGSEVGDFATASITEGFAKRFEVGYTSVMHANGQNQLPSISEHAGTWDNLYDGSAGSWDNLHYGKPTDAGFSSVNGKVNVISENPRWVPAISVGGIFRFGDHFVGDGATERYTTVYTSVDDVRTRTTTTRQQNTRNGDIYVVGSKTITQISKHVPVLFSAGLRGTDASLYGMAGNAPGFELRAFSSLALVFTGPCKSTIIVGTEFAQQPQQVKVGNLAVPTRDNGGLNVNIPSSDTWAVRFVPSPKYKLNLDAAILHASNSETRGVQTNVNDRVVFGASYGF